MDTHTTRRDLLTSLALSGAALAAAGGLGAIGEARAEDEPTAPAKPRKKMKLLVLGGTRFLGPAIVDAALANGHEVTLFNRGRSNPHLYPELEKLRGDRDGKLDALKGRTWDAVLDTSGFVPRITDMSAKLLADAVEQYVFVSSISVYPGFGTDDTTITEETPVAKMEDETQESMQFYGPLKALSERAIDKYFDGRATHVRSGLIVGPQDRSDRFSWWPYRFSRGGEILSPGDGTTGVQFIDVRDLGAWMVHTVEAKVAGVFNVTGFKGRVDFRDFLGALKCEIDTTTTLTWVPEDFLLEQEVRPFMGLPLWIPQGKLPHVDCAKAFDNGLICRPLARTARDTLDWIVSPDGRGDRKWRTGLKPEKEQAVLAAWQTTQSEKPPIPPVVAPDDEDK